MLTLVDTRGHIAVIESQMDDVAESELDIEDSEEKNRLGDRLPDFAEVDSQFLPALDRVSWIRDLSLTMVMDAECLVDVCREQEFDRLASSELFVREHSSCVRSTQPP